MNVETKIYLKKKFKDYYFKNKVPAPPEVHRREFGVGTLDDKIKARHKAFENERAFNQYLRTEAPFYISCSAAYYEYPANQPMNTKNWLGADLVFDLDVPMESGFLEEDALARVREETLHLMEFLEELGFQRKEMKVNFSGAKGYHIHISREDARELSGDQRREIVDYVTGSGLELSCFLREDEAEGVTGGRRGYTEAASVVRGPSQKDAGWAGRIHRAVHKYLTESDEKALQQIPGVGPRRAKKLLEDREQNLKALKRGNWAGILDVSENLLQRIIEEEAVRFTGDADKMVTIDTARLMRVPDTLHGGTGLKAARVKKLEEYEPLTQAVVFGDEAINVKVEKKTPGFALKGERHGPLNAGETALPEYAGLYLILKGKAVVAG